LEKNRLATGCSHVVVIGGWFTEIYGVSLGRGGVSLLAFRKQIIFAAIGLTGWLALSFSDYHRWRSYANYFYGLTIVLLISVLFFGSSINGTKGWFNLFGMGIQPVELAKIVLIIYLSSFFSSRTIRTDQTKNLIKSGVATLVLMILVLLQPDFGSALLLGAIWLIYIIILGFDRKYFLWLIGFGLIATLCAWFFLFTDIQKDRIHSFVDPGHAALGQSYNINQAMIAVGSGRVSGRGVGFGSQTQLKFLPEAQTDFIFAVIAEERGFLGTSLVLILFAIIIYKALNILPKVKDDFGSLVVVGSIGLLAIEVFVNIGMNIGILPVVGIALPLVSYGGSSLIANLLLLGLVNSVVVRARN